MINQKNILILASGSGSNAEVIVKNAQKQNLPIKFAVGCDKKPEVAGVYERMEKLGVVVHYLPAPYGDHSKLMDFLGHNKFDLIVGAGYMRILPPEVVDNHSVVNIHPSILPFVYVGSLDGYMDAFNAGDKYTGCTVHKMIPEVDKGPIIAQLAFEIPKGTDLDMLKKIGLAHEHALYPEAINSVVFGVDVNMESVARTAQNNIQERGLGAINTIMPAHGKLFKQFNPKEFIMGEYKRFEK
jgi:phosphoribosylglycinamide formyltransferase-1